MPVRIVSEKKRAALLEKAKTLGTGERDESKVAMTRKEFETAQTDLKAHFRVNGNEIGNTSQMLLWSKLKDLITKSSIPAPHGLAIHLGLDGAKNMVYGFRVLKFIPIAELEYEYRPKLCPPPVDADYVAPVHLYQAGEFNAILESEWKTYSDLYYSLVKVKRSNAQGASFEDLNAQDTRAIIFPWPEELEPFRNDNDPRIGTHNYHMRIDSISINLPQEQYDPNEPCATGNSGYRHGVCFYFEVNPAFGPWEPLLENDDEVVMFRNRAADYGNMCPPKCSSYSYPKDVK